MPGDSRTFDYAPAPESSDIVTVAPKNGLFISGQFVEPKSGRSFVTLNPATEEPLAEVAEAGEGDVDFAVQAPVPPSRACGAG